MGGEILVFATKETIPDALLETFSDLKVTIIDIPSAFSPKEQGDRALFRYRVFDFINDSHTWYIYSDCDVLAIKPINFSELLTNCDANKISVRRYLNRTQEGPWQAEQYTHDPRLVYQSGSGSGFLVFNSSIRVHMSNFLESHSQVVHTGPSWDQAYFNFYFLARNLLNITFDTYFLEERDASYNLDNYSDALFIDYCGLRSVNRFELMSDRFKDLL